MHAAQVNGDGAAAQRQGRRVALFTMHPMSRCTSCKIDISKNVTVRTVPPENHVVV